MSSHNVTTYSNATRLVEIPGFHSPPSKRFDYAETVVKPGKKSPLSSPEGLSPKKKLTPLDESLATTPQSRSLALPIMPTKEQVQNRIADLGNSVEEEEQIEENETDSVAQESSRFEQSTLNKPASR